MEENEKMFNTLLDRENFITSMLEFIKSKYDLVNTQIFIFGSTAPTTKFIVAIFYLAPANWASFFFHFNFLLIKII